MTDVARDAGSDPQGTAVELFADWVTRCERGEPIGFAQLKQDHPRLAPALDELHTTWRRLAQASDLSQADEPATLDPIESGELRVTPSVADRYRLEGEVARGGMGVVLRVWDRSLRRRLAMKLVLAMDAGATADATAANTTARLTRFLEEARVTGQLDHPGIVPVHELGLDGEGRHYFTMKLVEGFDLKRVFELVATGQEGWNETRALGVMLKVCEAMAYAHSKGIIHRDLKPANVMVGRFGEVFVMDWGLARTLRRGDVHDLRLATAGAPAGLPPSHEPAATPEAARDGELMTMDGVVLGTPAYMPPEQANGEIHKLTPRSDVYSIGAMLYHLLAHRAPYAGTGTPVPPQAVLSRVRAGPPTPLRQVNPAVPAELVAICEKAMAREPLQRYPDTLAFGEDLRAYLEHRVVAAYETGAVAELRKWVTRNRALATACAVAIVILVVAAVTSSSLFVLARKEADRADARAEDLKVANHALAAETKRAEDTALEAEGQRRIAAQRADDVLSLSAAQDLQELVTRAEALWPASPENVPRYETWLHDAGALIEGRAADASLGSRGRPGLADHRRKLAELTARALPEADPTGAVRFADRDDSWWHTQLTRLIADLEAFADADTGLCGSGTSPRHGWGMAQRLAVARTIAERSVHGATAAARWREAIAAIADPAACPRYRGLRLTPQLGLLPLGHDPASGLWEFAHLPSGEPAVRGADGVVGMHEGAGIVFVLIPGGTFWMGAQAKDPARRNHDPMARPEEAPVHQVSVDPFFLSKFEMTQDQWRRFTGANPSAYGPGTVPANLTTTSLHPVEQVTWRQATTVLVRLDLVLPTEAQWEFAARAGTDTPWWTGREAKSLLGAANLADSFARRNDGPSAWGYDDWLDDGRTVHAPVGSYRANGNGLFDVAGNVHELCRDGFGRYDKAVRRGDGERQDTDPRSHMIRGGGYHTRASFARSAFRIDSGVDYFDFATGLRPARTVRD